MNDSKILRASIRVTSQVQVLESFKLPLADLGYTGLSIESLARLQPPDEFEDELIVMADVRAYFQVAYKRIIDSIPLTIEHSLNQHLADTLQKSLVKNLDLGSPDAGRRLADLLAEDPAIAARRVELEAKLRRLEDVQRELEGFRNLNL